MHRRADRPWVFELLCKLWPKSGWNRIELMDTTEMLLSKHKSEWRPQFDEKWIICELWHWLSMLWGKLFHCNSKREWRRTQGNVGEYMGHINKHNTPLLKALTAARYFIIYGLALWISADEARRGNHCDILEFHLPIMCQMGCCDAIIQQVVPRRRPERKY